MDILFVLGTKAQYIKTIPMINHAIENNYNVTVVDLKQHPEKTKLLIDKIKGEYVYKEYVKNQNDLGTYLNLIRWFLTLLIKIFFTRDNYFNNNFSVVHGDTLSTLVGALLIRKNKGRLVLLEAGLGFPGMFKHFPESFVRYYVAKFSHYLIANGEDQINQLKEWNVKGNIIEISRNTIYDSLDLVSLEKDNSKKKVVVSIHRTENINSKDNMYNLVEIISQISSSYNVVWYLHIPTKNKLESFNLINNLNNANVILDDLIPYETFLSELYNSEFVITDGDGVTEECHILGVPTLVWRYEHLDSNHLFEGDSSLYLSEFDDKQSKYFFNNYKDYRTERKKDEKSPSLEALEGLINEINKK